MRWSAQQNVGEVLEGVARQEQSGHGEEACSGLGARFGGWSPLTQRGRTLGGERCSKKADKARRTAVEREQLPQAIPTGLGEGWERCQEASKRRRWKGRAEERRGAVVGDKREAGKTDQGQGHGGNGGATKRRKKRKKNHTNTGQKKLEARRKAGQGPVGGGGGTKDERKATRKGKRTSRGRGDPSLPRRCRPPSAEDSPMGAPRVGASLAGG